MSIVGLYLSGGVAYGLWVLVVLQFRTCGIFSSCPDLPAFPSRIINAVLAFMPDAVLYSLLIAIGRGITWLPNLVMALIGYDDQSFLDWFLVRDVMPMPEFYSALSTLLP
jgi:hypothetical protein